MIILDTHVLVWWAENRGQLSVKAADIIDHETVIGLSPITCWEISMLASKGRLDLADGPGVWLSRALAHLGIELIPISMEAAVLAGDTHFMPGHGDPADRLIAASAITQGVALVTKDTRLAQLNNLTTIW